MSAQQWNQARRATSPRGTWLALTSADALHLARLREGTKSVVWSKSIASGSAPVALGFSPDEHFVTVQRGTNLDIWSTESGEKKLFALGAVQDIGTEACDEDVFGSPSWCGASPQTRLPVWSTDSRYLATVLADGRLSVNELPGYSASSTLVPSPYVATCVGRCPSSLRFQP